MRIVGMSEVDAFCARRPETEAPLHALLTIITRAEWRNTVEIAHQFGDDAYVVSASHVRVDLSESRVRVEMDLDFRKGAVTLHLTSLPPSRR